MPIDARAAVQLLLAGQPVALPTETVYGLACILTEDAAAKVFALKGRPADNPFIVHIASFAGLREVAADIPGPARALTRAFWPGPLTLVLPRRASVPALITAGLPSVAVRCPGHALAREIITAAGPLAAPSANISGRPSPTSAAHVLAELDVPVVDGGPCAVGLESTVVSLLGPVPRLLRPGAVTLEQLQACVGRVDAPPQDEERPASPGQKYRHYAPKTRLVITSGERPPGAWLIAPEADAARMDGARVIPYTARTLYDVLRRVDTLGVSEVCVLLPAPLGEGLALCDRLRRAAGAW
jgi:L-threonylcarbamoyladenylate synthase